MKWPLVLSTIHDCCETNAVIELTLYLSPDDARDRCDGAAATLCSSAPSKVDKGEIFARFAQFFPEETLFSNCGVKLDRRPTGTFTTTSGRFFNAALNMDAPSTTTSSGSVGGSDASGGFDAAASEGESPYVEYSGPAKTVMPVSKTAHPFWGKTATSWRGAEPLRYTSTTKVAD